MSIVVAAADVHSSGDSRSLLGEVRSRKIRPGHYRLWAGTALDYYKAVLLVQPTRTTRRLLSAVSVGRGEVGGQHVDVVVSEAVESDDDALALDVSGRPAWVRRHVPADCDFNLVVLQ